MLLSEKQKEFIRNANKRYNIKTGATRSGKTYLDILYTIPSRIRERSGMKGLNVILVRDWIWRGGRNKKCF